MLYALADELAKFLSTPSGWRATCTPFVKNLPRVDFYPRPPGGGRHQGKRPGTVTTDFYPRPPGGGRHLPAAALLFSHCNFYPRPPGGGRHPDGDALTYIFENFYPRPPGGGRLHNARRALIVLYFYPRPPGGGRLTFAYVESIIKCNFYPRPPGGGRQQKRTKFSSVFAQKGEEFASLRRGKREFAGGVLKRTNFGF